MLGNALKTAWRNIHRQKGYSFINVAGLALGMACAILIVSFIHHELSFDRFHKKAGRISRVVTDATLRQERGVVPAAPMALGAALAGDYPEVAAVVRVQPLSKTLVKYADRSFYETGLLYADASVFDVFTFPLLAGDPLNALARANAVVLTERTARKYFGGEDPIGRILRFNDEADFVVSGVMKDVPGNSHLQFDFLVSLETRLSRDPELGRDWFNLNIPTYVLFRTERGPQEIAPKLAGLVEERLGPFLRSLGGKLAYSFQPLTKIHLSSGFAIDFVAVRGNMQYVYAFAAIALFMIAIACMNFMNLATARSARRAREVGLRKAVGAGRPALLLQFLAEATTHSLMSLAVALFLVWLALPVFKSISGIDPRLGMSQLAWLVPSLLGLVLLVGLAAGSYPAVYLSSLQPVSTLKGAWKAGPGSARFRRVLVVVQFLIGIALIIGTAAIRRQLDFMRNRDLGFSADQVLVTRIDNPAAAQRIESVKARLKEIPGVLSAALTQAVPGQETEANVQAYVPEGLSESEPLMFRQFFIDEDFVPTLGLDIVGGRNFAKERPTDADALLINEATARKLGWADPLGRKIKVPAALTGGRLSWREKTVIGVVRDFHFLGLRELIEPLLLERGERMDQLLIKLKTNRLSATIRELERAWAEIDPSRPLDFFFLDAFFNAQYRTEESLGRLVAVFSGLAIVIACLGLFGLAAFAAEQRTKEIGVRKVLGASVYGILSLVSREFMILVTIANLIAWPAGYLLTSRLLRGYAYRTDVPFWIFLGAGALAYLIALLTISVQAVKAARTDPVQALRYE